MEKDKVVPIQDNNFAVKGINRRAVGKTGSLPVKLSQYSCLIILFFLEIQG